MPKWYKWTIEVQTTETWVADGFNIDNERAHEMLVAALPYALNSELKARVISKPDQKQIATAQGYKSVRQMKASKQ